MDPDRIGDLTRTFQNGEWGMNVFSDVQVLDLKDCDGNVIVDDGLQTVQALKDLREAWSKNKDAPCCPKLVAIFEKGLWVKEVQYEENENRFIREAWNAARHDEENNRYQPTELYRKIEVAQKFKQRHGSWEAGQKELLKLYGSGKRTTVGRWFRAAKSMDNEVLLKLKEYKSVKGAYIFDNPFFTAQGVNAAQKLSPQHALTALELLMEEFVDGEARMTYLEFPARVCKPLKIVELWERGQVKRFGVVATGSGAFQRVVKMLSTRGGVQKVCMVMSDGTPLHGRSEANRGIEECYLIVKEMEKCLAGGLPPPAVLPGAADKAVEEAAPALPSAGEDPLQATPVPEEALMMTLGSSEGAAEDPEHAAALAAARAELDHITLAQTVDELVAQLAKWTEHRFFFLLEAPTSRMKVLADFIDATKRIVDGLRCKEKVRVVLLVHSRFDQMSNAVLKIGQVWPQWTALPVQLAKRALQSRKNRSQFAFLTAPGPELQDLPTVVTVPASCRSYEQVRMRCTERDCPLRSSAQRASLAESCENIGEEIRADDQEVDLLASMMQDVELEEEEGDEETLAVGEEGEALRAPQKKDYICDLWPFAHPIAHYERVFDELGCQDVSVCVIMSTTAHPASWLAARRAGSEVFVLANRPSAHSLAHGRALALAIRLAEKLKEVGKASPVTAQPVLNCIQGPDLTQVAQTIEAREISAGDLWYEGLNKRFGGEDLAKVVRNIVRTELDGNCLRVTGPDGEKGRGLAACVGFREGQVWCDATVLWYDSEAEVRAFLALPGNQMYADRIVKVSGILSEGSRRDHFAVLIGLAQFAQHYSSIKKTANACFTYDPSQGFNRHALRLTVSTRNACGVAPGSEVVLNYGGAFDLSVARPTDPSAQHFQAWAR